MKNPGRTKFAGRGLMAGILTAVLAGTVLAGTALGAPLVTDSGSGTPRSNFSGTVGYAFTTDSTPVYVSSLGLWDEDPDGLASAHQVGLWTDGGTLLGTTTVGSAADNWLHGEFRYAQLDSGVTLAPNTTYRIAAEVFSGGDAFRTDNDDPILNANFALQSSIDGNYHSGSFDYPEGTSGSGNAFTSASFWGAPMGERISLVLDNSTGGVRNGFSGAVGYEFTTADGPAMLVDSLGFWDSEQNGLQNEHEVGLWTEDGTLLASTTVQSGTSSILVDEFRYEDLLVPVLLEPNTTYRIAGAVFAAGDPFRADDGMVQVDPIVADPNSSAMSGWFHRNSFGFPGEQSGAGYGHSFGSASLQATLVPEPSAAALAIMAVLGLFGLIGPSRRFRA